MHFDIDDFIKKNMDEIKSEGVANEWINRHIDVGDGFEVDIDMVFDGRRQKFREKLDQLEEDKMREELK